MHSSDKKDSDKTEKNETECPNPQQEEMSIDRVDSQAGNEHRIRYQLIDKPRGMSINKMTLSNRSIRFTHSFKKRPETS